MRLGPGNEPAVPQVPRRGESCAGHGHGQSWASFKAADDANPPGPGAVLLGTRDAFCGTRNSDAPDKEK